MLTVLQTALEVGLIYGLVALALFISFSILNIADLSTDGCFTLGCAVGAMLTIAGHPILALFAAMAAGMLSGYVTAFLQTRLGVESILAGIISNTGLYTINLAVMGFSSNVSITGVDTVFSLFKGLVGGQWSRLILLALIAAVIVLVLIRFFGTSLGLSIRATGDSLDMVSASSINPKATITIGLCLANALTALSGCLIGNTTSFATSTSAPAWSRSRWRASSSARSLPAAAAAWASASSASCSAASSTASSSRWRCG